MPRSSVCRAGRGGRLSALARLEQRVHVRLEHHAAHHRCQQCNEVSRRQHARRRCVASLRHALLTRIYMSSVQRIRHRMETGRDTHERITQANAHTTDRERGNATSAHRFARAAAAALLFFSPRMRRPAAAAHLFVRHLFLFPSVVPFAPHRSHCPQRLLFECDELREHRLVPSHTANQPQKHLLKSELCWSALGINNRLTTLGHAARERAPARGETTHSFSGGWLAKSAWRRLVQRRGVAATKRANARSSRLRPSAVLLRPQVL